MKPSTRTTVAGRLEIPRAPVFGSTTIGDSRISNWQRIDQQGPCLFTTSGRAAILLALRALGVGPGDEVLLPTYHCPTMIEPTVLIGAKPLFYPIGPEGAADMSFLQRTDTSRAKALLAAHYFGLPQDLGEVRAFCDARQLPLVEDCAHAFFGSSPRGPIGSVGDMAIGSLGKFFPVVEGGCLIARAPTRELPKLRAPGLLREARVAWDILELGAAAGRLGRAGAMLSTLARLKNRLRGRPAEAWRVAESEPDHAAACNTIDIARAQTRATSSVRWIVRHADAQRIARLRRANYRAFAELLGKERRMRPLFPELPDGAVPYVFPLEVDDPVVLYPAIRKRNVPVFRWDIVWPGTPTLPGDLGTRWATQVLQISCHQDMSESDVVDISSAIRAEAMKSCP